MGKKKGKQKDVEVDISAQYLARLEDSAWNVVENMDGDDIEAIHYEVRQIAFAMGDFSKGSGLADDDLRPSCAFCKKVGKYAGPEQLKDVSIYISGMGHVSGHLCKNCSVLLGKFYKHLAKGKSSDSSGDWG